MSLPPPPTFGPRGVAKDSLEGDFVNDPRLHFSKESNSWIFEDDDGQEMEWHPTTSTWLPLLDEASVQAQQAAYSREGIDENLPAKPVLQRESKKRKKEQDSTNGSASDQPIAIKRTKGNDSVKKETKPSVSKNTAVYVTGLPADTEVDELVERFSKFGVLMEDDDGEPRIKLYADDQGRFNGEALIVFFKEESVVLAESLLDDAELRLGDASTRMKVRKADFAHKGGTEGSEVKRRVVDKKKATRRIVKLQKKLEEWDSEDEFGPSKEPEDESSTAPSRVVVLKHMFTLEDLAEDPTLMLDLKEDVREECETMGTVTNVVLYDKEPDGIMTVKFKDLVSAQACLLKMNGRFFSGRRIEASYLRGKPRFMKSGHEQNDEEEDEVVEKQRLDDFARWLEKDKAT